MKTLLIILLVIACNLDCQFQEKQTDMSYVDSQRG